jgi:hypothetical protein
MTSAFTLALLVAHQRGDHTASAKEMRTLIGG